MKRFWFDVKIDGKVKSVFIQADTWDEAISFIKAEESSATYTGMQLEDWKLIKEEIGKPKVGKGVWVRVIMGEGRKRQIRETCQQLGLPIVRILRIRIGTLRLANLKPRQWRYLTTEEVDELKGKVISTPTHRPPRPQRPQGTARSPRTPKPARSK